MILFMAASIYLAANLPALTWIRFVVWIIIGLAVYFIYGRRHSLLAGRDAPSPAPGKGLLEPAAKNSPGRGGMINDNMK